MINSSFSPRSFMRRQFPRYAADLRRDKMTSRSNSCSLNRCLYITDTRRREKGVSKRLNVWALFEYKNQTND